MSRARHLQGLRGKAVVSRAELARRAGVPVSTLRHWESDRGFPGAPAFLRLAEALGVPAERLGEGVEDPAEEEAAAAEAKLRRTRKRRTS
jgi:transcriptional regulator with XRE-family HTH domain